MPKAGGAWGPRTIEDGDKGAKLLRHRSVKGSMRIETSLSGLVLALASTALAQPPRAPHADPYYAYEVSGTAVDPQNRGVRGVVVERVRSATDSTPYAPHAYRTVTEPNGRFRLAFSGIGTPTGRTWWIAVRASGCRTRIHRIALTTISRNGRDIDVAENLRLATGDCSP